MTSIERCTETIFSQHAVSVSTDNFVRKAPILAYPSTRAGNGCRFSEQGCVIFIGRLSIYIDSGIVSALVCNMQCVVGVGV